MAAADGPNLGLRYGYAVGETGWGVTGFNPNMAALDTLVHLAVLAQQDAPPVSPTAGDRYIVGAGSGEWDDHDDEVAAWDGTAWVYYVPSDGWQAWNVAAGALWLFDGGWAAAPAGAVPAGSISTAELGGDITAAGKDLLDDANAAAQRTTLGLGTAATEASSAFQAADATLTALAAMTYTARAVVELTAADTFTLRPVGVTNSTDLLDRAAGDGRFQPLDAELTAIAGLTSAADKGVMFTGAGTAGAFDLTTAGRNLLDDADAAAQRTTLGLPALITTLHNWTATTDPAAGDDGLDGYIAGSMWFNTSAGRLWACVSASTGAAVWRVVHTDRTLSIGAAANRWAWMAEGALSTAAYGAADVLYLYPFILDTPRTVTEIGMRTTAGGAGSSVKGAVWTHDFAAGRPTSVPVLGQNAGWTTTAGGDDSTVISSVLLQAGPWWWGSKCTGTPPTMVSVGSGHRVNLMTPQGSIGQLTNNRNGLSAPDAYANDIMATDLTSATFTALNSSQVPALALEWA